MSRPPEDPPRYSSPPCYAGEFPGYFGEPAALDPALVARLNALLEAERAGAKLLALLAREAAPDSALRALLEALRHDEAAGAVGLYQGLRRRGAAASSNTGDFVERTLALDGMAQRLAFLNRGQEWVVRRIDELLPDVGEGELRTLLGAMREWHVGNIGRCQAALDAGWAQAPERSD